MKFNQTNTNKTVNKSGYAAYKMEDKEKLATMVLTSLFGEPKYYGDNTNEMMQLAENMAVAEPEFVAKLACYARNEGNLRSVSHALTAVIARHAPAYTRRVVRKVVVRPDDITEIMACYQSLYGKPFPNALKREVAEVIQRFNEYSLAKYNSGNKKIKFKDVLRITHPKPKTEKISTLFNKVLNDELETPYTWEVELSTHGNTREVWDELIASGQVGYMALLRNLRNIIRSGADLTPVLEKIADPEQVKKSRQLPFRFYSAYHTLKSDGLMTPKIHKALESAICASIDNLDILEGRTLIAVDVSGSMSWSVSAKSDVKCRDIASLMGAMSARMCESATVCYFDAAYWSDDKGYKIVNYGKFDSVLATADANTFDGGGTDISLPLKWALNEDTSLVPFDRVIYFSDNESNSGLKSAQSLVNEYRNTKNPNLWVHGVDLQGYGTQQFYGKNFNLISGWGDSVLSFISQAEKGMDTLVQAIEKYSLD